MKKNQIATDLYELSVPKKIYVKQSKNGRWLFSNIYQPGYTEQWYATKVSPRMYYDTEGEAQERADKYNKRFIAYRKGKGLPIQFPSEIKWSWFSGTALHDKHSWGHEMGSWLYANGYDEWETSELLQNAADVEYQYKDDWNHSTIDFFNLLFSQGSFNQYDLKKIKGKYEIIFRQ